jgi:hypothetical protein
MNTINYNIKIENEKFGTLMNETFIDRIQFKLFLSMVHGCLELKNDLTFFNGDDFLINIPYKYLSDSIVMTSTSQYEFTNHVKSKIEALVTK